MKNNIVFNRERFASVLKWCKENNVVAEESIIRVSQPLESGNGNLSFDIKNGKRAANDVVLDRNDLFIPYGFGLFLAMEEVDSQNNPKGKASLYSYAPKAGAAVPVGFMTEDAQALYNGLMKISFGQTVVNSSLPTLNFKHVPETQPIVIYNGEEMESTGVQPEFDIMDSLYPLAPKYYMQGTEDIRIDVSFPAVDSNFAVAENGASTASTTYKPQVYFVALGVLAKNAAQAVKDNPLLLANIK